MRGVWIQVTWRGLRMRKGPLWPPTHISSDKKLCFSTRFSVKPEIPSLPHPYRSILWYTLPQASWGFASHVFLVLLVSLWYSVWRIFIWDGGSRVLTWINLCDLLLKLHAVTFDNRFPLPTQCSVNCTLLKLFFKNETIRLQPGNLAFFLYF